MTAGSSSLEPDPRFPPPSIGVPLLKIWQNWWPVIVVVLLFIQFALEYWLIGDRYVNYGIGR
jgi:hypothetical protein